MKNFIREVFGETGDISMMRVMCFIVCMTACYIAVTKRADELGVISVLLGTAFSSKIAQKKIEVDGDSPQSDTKKDGV